jgi:hypothetical protein
MVIHPAATGINEHPAQANALAEQAMSAAI